MSEVTTFSSVSRYEAVNGSTGIKKEKEPPPCEPCEMFEKIENVPGPRRKRDAADAAEDMSSVRQSRRRHRLPSWLTANTPKPAVPSGDNNVIECTDPEDTSTGPAVMVMKTTIKS